MGGGEGKKCVVINRCYGGFSLSDEAIKLWAEKKEKLSGVPAFPKNEHHQGRNVARDDPCLIEVVRELGPRANGRCAELQIVTVPERYRDTWKIGEYDGFEHLDWSASELVAKMIMQSPAPETLSLTDCQQLLLRCRQILLEDHDVFSRQDQ